MSKKKPYTHHVMRDTDVGTMCYFPYLRKDHAERLAALLNEIETDRVERLGGKRENSLLSSNESRIRLTNRTKSETFESASVT